MKKIFIITPLLLGMIRTAHAAVQWQSSVSPSVRLAVRDKFGELKHYRATFRVKAADGKVCTQTIAVTDDNFGEVDFPSAAFIDGKGHSCSWADEHQVYTWEVRVNGTTAFTDHFTLGGS